jgi:hypothetical protein
MAAAGMPAGWYRDPAARHEQRYWDGGRWSSHVLDGPLSSEDALAAFGASAAHFAPGPGYRAYRFAYWRRLLSIMALLAVAAALALTVTAAILLQALGPTPSAVEQWIFYWAYTTAPDGGPLRLSPDLLWIGLALALTTVGVAIANRQATLVRAGGKVARPWSSREDKQRWQAGLQAMAAARVGWTIRYGLRGWLCVVAGTLGSVLVLVVAANTIASRYGFSPTGNLAPVFHLGLGPWLSLAGGVGGLLAVLLVLPWRLGSEIAIYPNGYVTTLEGNTPADSGVDAAPVNVPTTTDVADGAAETQAELRLTAVREFALSSKTPAQMARRLGLKRDELTTLLAQRELRFSSGATSGNTYTGRDRSLWEANKQSLFDSLVSQHGSATILERAAAIAPDWFNTAGGELLTGLAELGGMGISNEARDRSPIPANERRLAWVGFIFAAALVGITIGLATPVGLLWQSSYFGWRDGSRAEPRAAAALGVIGLLPVTALAVLLIFSLVIGPVLMMLGVK